LRRARLTLLLQITLLTACGSAAGVEKRPVAKKNPSADASGDTSNDTTSSSSKPATRNRPSGVGANGSPESSGQAPGDTAGSPPIEGLSLNPELPGPHPVKSYTEGLADSAYSSAVVYYPSDLQNLRPATTLSGGYTNTKEQMIWLAEHLASHGFVVQVFTPTNPNSTDPRIWETGHLGSVKKLKMESARAGSPIRGLVDPARLAVMGFSMGGAGTILAVNSQKEPLRAAIALCPYQPQSLSARVPTMFVTGTNDFVAVPANVERAFTSISPDTPKAFLNLDGLTHQNITSPGAFRRQLSRYLTTWYQVFLADQTSYKKYLAGSEADTDKAQGGIAALNFVDK